MRDDGQIESDQQSFLVWVPTGAERALCLAYGGRVSASLLASLASQVDIDTVPLESAGPWDVVLLIGHPAADRPKNREKALADYLDTIAAAWARLKPSGKLILALDSSGAAGGIGAAVLAWLRPRTWFETRSIERAVRALGATHTVRLHAFPSVWRPMLLHTPEAPAVVKRMALAHIGGWRAGQAAKLLVRDGRASALDLCPAGIVWVASR